MRGQLHIT